MTRSTVIAELPGCTITKFGLGFLFMFASSLIWVWLAGICLQIVLATVLVTRRAWRKFPVFFLYFMANLLMNVVLFLARAARSGGFFFYSWITSGLALGLCPGGGVQVLLRLFSPLPPVPNTTRPRAFYL